MLNIDIDTGGTMTDGLVSGSCEAFSVKVETTPHDMTISFLNILAAARERLGVGSLRELLDDVELVRWSSTITSNVLAQRTGPKLGLLVSAGHEDDLYGSPEEASTVLGELILREDVTGIADNASDEEVRAAVKGLFDRGIRRINISLADQFPDNSRERKVVSMIDAHYPDHYLGSIPALPAGEILQRSDDMTRTFVSLINAYVHPSLASTLYKAEETVRVEHGWRGNVLVGHINGGVARIGKTTAYDTIESGPLFGTHATADYAWKDGSRRVLAIDVGGTTAKASAVEDGWVAEREESSLFGIPLKMNLPLLRSIALGGGSVARVWEGAVTLGPDSMGAAPGPACYGLGGRHATLTDAFVVLGLVDPDGFLDGRRQLDTAKAGEVIDKSVAGPLEVTAENAAEKIVDTAYEAVAQLARDTAAEQGWDPAETEIYAFGGNGPLFATGVAERLGVSRARFFQFGSVLSAYGSAISDVVHVYERAVGGAEAVMAARQAAGQMRAEAERDLRGEGFAPERARMRWDVRTNDGSLTTAEGDFDRALPREGQPSLLRLTAEFPLPSVDYTANGSGTGGAAPTGQRQSPLGTSGALPTYDWAQLAGTEINGPALVDGGSFTWLAGQGWSISVDGRGDATVTKGASQ